MLNCLLCVLLADLIHIYFIIAIKTVEVGEKKKEINVIIIANDKLKWDPTKKKNPQKLVFIPHSSQFN